MSKRTKAKRRERKRSHRVAPGGPYTSWQAFREDRQRAAKGIRLHPIVPLHDGTTGYGVDPARCDDCFQAAIATATQIPVEQVPDPGLDERWQAGENPADIDASAWQRILVWAETRGLRMALHEVPLAHPRWIGVVPPPGGQRGVWDHHCLVMSYGELVFDPSVTVRTPPGQRRRIYSPEDIEYGITFDPDRKDDA